MSGAAAQLGAAKGSIAYLGNSVTRQGDGYRPQLHRLLMQRFGHEHRAINAGFGGVGSVASVCTMDDMVIRYRPQLCFIETLTGDMGVGPHPDIGAALEGMLLKLAAIGASPCFLHLPRQSADFSTANPILQVHRAVADRYRCPVVDLAERLSGETGDFFRDGIHTTPEGGLKTANLIAETLEPMFERREAGSKVPRLHAADYARARFVEPAASDLREPAAGRAGRFRLRYPYIEFGPDNALRFQSSNLAVVGLFLVIGPHSGSVRINDHVYPLHDRWCSYERIHALILPQAIDAATRIEIAPLRAEGDPPRPLLKLIGPLTRPVTPPSGHRSEPAVALAAHV